ncbi:MAG: hypothetical protein ABIK09_13625 [Pseudomonadota bacterium]
MNRTITTIGLLLLALVGSAALADEPTGRTRDELVRLADKGFELAAEGRIEDAIRIWRDILPETTGRDRLDLQYNLYFAHMKLEQLPEAWHFLTSYLKDNTKEDLEAGAALEALDRRLHEEKFVKIAITCDPLDAWVYIGDAAAGPRLPCPLTWWFQSVEKYKHFVTVVRDDYLPKTVELDLIDRGAQGGVLVALEPEKTIPVKVADPDPTIIEEPVTPYPLRRAAWKWALLGTGAAIALGGGALHLAAWEKSKTLNRRYPATEIVTNERVRLSKDLYNHNRGKYLAGWNDQVVPMNTSGWVLVGLGAATAATGLVFILTHQYSPADEGTDLSLTPLSLPGGGGMVMEISF